MSRYRYRNTFLDRVHKLSIEPADLRVFQSGLPRSLQKYAAVRVLFALQTRAVRPRGARFPSAVPKVRSGLTRWGTHYILSLFSLFPLFRLFNPWSNKTFSSLYFCMNEMIVWMIWRVIYERTVTYESIRTFLGTFYVCIIQNISKFYKPLN